jgi:hypothetical protein
VKFQTFLGYASALAASFLLATCGGGGATGNPNQGGPISAEPENGTFYAGVPATITLSGGRKPYGITSSDPGVLPVPAIVDGNSFEVIPNNPGVVDVGIAAGGLQVKTVVVDIRDTTGILVSVSIKVAQNFLTGYGIQFVASTCPSPAAGAAVTPCAGGDTAVQLAATFNGSLHGNQTFRLEVVRGTFAFFTPESSPNIISSTYTTVSDHEGKITAVIRVPAGTPTQIAILRVVDVATGASVDQVFTIEGGNTTPLVLTAIPSTLTFTGSDATVCGTGSGDVFVFDGVPPYTAVASNPAILISPSTSGTQPGRFTITVASTQACPTASPVIITDSLGNRVVVSVTSSRGAAAAVVTATPVTVAPNAIILACGTSGSVSAVGGKPPYSVSSTHPRVTATVLGNTITITRLPGPDPINSPLTGTVSVTDGSSAASIAVTFPAGGNPDPITGRCS